MLPEYPLLLSTTVRSRGRAPRNGGSSPLSWLYDADLQGKTATADVTPCGRSLNRTEAPAYYRRSATAVTKWDPGTRRKLCCNHSLRCRLGKHVMNGEGQRSSQSLKADQIREACRQVVEQRIVVLQNKYASLSVLQRTGTQHACPPTIAGFYRRNACSLPLDPPSLSCSSDACWSPLHLPSTSTVKHHKRAR